MAEVTAVLLNYKRPKYCYDLMCELRGQTVPVDTILIDNSEDSDFFSMLAGDVAYVAAPWNAGCWIRLPFARYANTKYIMFMDDDVFPAMDTFVSDALSIVEDSGCMVGVEGRTIAKSYPFYRDDVFAGYAPIIKGRFMLFQKKMLDKVHLSTYGGGHDARFLEDIFMSLETGRGKNSHFVSDHLGGMLRERNPDRRDGLGISESPDHMKNRNDFTEWYMRKEGWV